MSSSDIKIEIFRLIDNQEEETLRVIYELLKKELAEIEELESSKKSMDELYKEMAIDTERESEAMEWVNNTINPNDI
jgi:hypothetical protein